MQCVHEGSRYKVTSMLIPTINNTNLKHLELFTVLRENNNAWESVLHSKYGIIPQFVHVDKDVAEIG